MSLIQPKQLAGQYYYITGSFSGDGTGLQGVTSSIYTGSISGIDYNIQYKLGNDLGSSNLFQYIEPSQSFKQGNNITVTGLYSHGAGENNIVNGRGSYVGGRYNTNDGAWSHVVGSGNYISSSIRYAFAGGSGSRILVPELDSFGYPIENVTNWWGFAFGNEVLVVAGYGFATGQQTTSSRFGHSEGSYTYAGFSAHAEGRSTYANSRYSHAEGTGTEAGGKYVEPFFISASAPTQDEEGDPLKTGYLWYNTNDSLLYRYSGSIWVSQNDDPITLGTWNTSSATFSIITVGLGDSLDPYAAEQARFNYSSGYYSHAEGSVTKTLGRASHAEGYASIAGGWYSHAEGYSTRTGIPGQAGAVEFGGPGTYSHAEGYQSIAAGYASHAEGYGTRTLGTASHAEGLATIASGSYQSVMGKYNTQNNTNSLVIIGGGTSNNNRQDLALFNSDSIIFNQPITASTVSGSFIGDGSGLTNVPGTGGGYAQLTITTTSDFNTSDLIGGTSQNGKHVVVNNGSSNITITVDNAVNSFYQMIGTGNITFVSGSGRTLTAPNGSTISTQYNGASLSFNGTENIVILSNAGFFFDESPELRLGDYRIAEQINDPRFPPLTPLNSSSGEYLIINTSNYVARTQDTWFDLAVDYSNLPGTITDYTFYAKRIVPGYSDLAIGLQFTSSVTHSYVQTNARYPLSNGIIPSSKTMAFEITAKSGSQYVDSVVHKFQVEPTSSLVSGSTISLVIDVDSSSSYSPSSSLVFGIPFAPGELWDEDRVTLQYVGGSPIEYQREITGNWITSGSIQWVQLRTVAPSGSQLEVVIDGTNNPSTGSNLITDLGGGQYEMIAGDYTLTLAKEHSPIKTIKKGATTIADNVGAKGLYLYVSNTALTASGELAQSSDDVDITIESAGPVSSCIKIEGDYKTSGGDRVAKHITRLESHKGIDGVNISHTLVLSNSTNNIWFSEMGWEFSTNPTTATSVTALFNLTSSNLENISEIYLTSSATASILQDIYPTFGRSGATSYPYPHFSIYEDGTETVSYPTASVGEWFGYKSDNNGLVWGIQDTARQAPKEVVVTRDKINLMMFSPNGGEEIDFRNSTLWYRWNLDNIIGETGSYQGTTSASFAATPSDAYGWSKTTNLLLLPINTTPDTSSIAAETNKLLHPDYGYVDANWMYQSEALGPLYPYDSVSFDLAEKTIDGNISAYTASVPGDAYNTFFDYYNGPAYFYNQRYRLSYTLIHDSWLLTARNANRNEDIRRQTRKFSENVSRAFRDSYICHLDEPLGTDNRKFKGLFIEGNGPAGDFPMYWEKDPGYNLATSGDILPFIWDYHISGDRRSKDVAIDYGNGFKNNFSYTTRRFRTLPNIKHITHAYQLSGDYEMLLAVEKLKNSYSSIVNQSGPLVYDKDGALLLSKIKAYDSTTYKTNTDVGSFIQSWKVTGSDVFKQIALRLAKYWRNTKMGKDALTRIYGQYDTFLYYNSGLLSQGQIIDFNFRGKNLKYNTTTGGNLNVGFSTYDTVLGGMPYQMDVISKTSASLQPVSSFVAFRDYQNTNPIFVKKNNNGKGIITYLQPSSATSEDENDDDANLSENTTRGGLDFTILKNPATTQTWSGNDPIPVTQNGVNPGTAIQLEISRDLGANNLTRNFAYKFQPTIRGNQFLVTDSTASVVFRSDGYWMPRTVRPNYTYYFNVTSSASSPTIFFEYGTNLYDPTGSLYTGAAVSKSVSLPSTGLWSFKPIDYPSLVSSSGMPPYFAINSGSFWFDPLTTIGADENDSVYNDIEVQPQYYPNLGSTVGSLISGSLVGGGSGTLRIASSSGDTELFSNVSGTLEFYFKPDNWDSFTMPSTTDNSINFDLSPVTLYRKWMMQVITARRPEDPPLTGSSTTGNRSWAIDYWLLPQGSRGSTAYPSLEPTHTFYSIFSYYNETGSGATGVANNIWAQQEIILQDKWHHMAITWNENNAPAFYINGRKTSGNNVSAGYYNPQNPWYINFPEYLKGYITQLRVSSDVVYTSDFTPSQGDTPYGFVSGSTVFYLPLSASGDTSYIASGSKTIDVSYI